MSITQLQKGFFSIVYSFHFLCEEKIHFCACILYCTVYCPLVSRKTKLKDKKNTREYFTSQYEENAGYESVEFPFGELRTEERHDTSTNIFNF